MPRATHAPYTFWLVPQEPLKTELRAIIDRLADEWKAAAFDPHVTIYAGPSSDAEIHQIGQKIVNQYGPIELAVQGLRQSDIFTKTFFIQFAASDFLRQLSTDIKNASAEEADYELNPHLSLLYQKTAEGPRQALCHEVVIPAGIYRFDTLQVIHIDKPFDDPRSIKGWRRVFNSRLKGY